MNGFQSQKHGIKLVTNQVPGMVNNHTAVVTATIGKGDGLFSGIGVGQPANLNGTTDCQALLDKASQTAIHNAKQLAGFAMAGGKNAPEGRYAQTTARTRGHSTQAGSISPNQKHALKEKAERNGTSLDRIARDKFGISASELSSQQANMLFKKFNNR